MTGLRRVAVLEIGCIFSRPLHVEMGLYLVGLVLGGSVEKGDLPRGTSWRTNTIQSLTADRPGLRIDRPVERRRHLALSDITRHRVRTSRLEVDRET